ncbi:two-component system, OmpR family, alkaline phosphatase synthesis response regulator PhoP [Pseudobutyrivibrio sp. NOR37]|uniref:Stage 0 sporulation protein A homolog n=1 Tax=Pseudobutyrivibrio xylanivorans TaxID=185007 RepID=A0A6M0LIN0_PSEXY|nr:MULTISPECIES: response regulator transcription factor [Pseudobutyrivibrio]NEX02342.1 response regulator transcription factor [Pseudobutyrivibrio xylanivorans]SFR78326.1 two-component system, OmpR family, alkaline phosphatase synthesis response regulator PhoP [Pseudobutyrivibrio sp. NOR37]
MALIYIVEDDENIREIEEFALENAGFSVNSFSDAASFFASLERKLPDLVLLDIMLPDENGNDILTNIRASEITQSIPVIMVTAKTTELDLARGLEIGADDYIKKPFSVVELTSRVKALLRRTSSDGKQIIRIDELVLDEGKHTVSLGDSPVELTFKEYELLKYLLMNRGLVLKRAQIMDKIWGMDYELESRTLDMHIKSLRTKLRNYGDRILTVRNVGYKFE